MTGDIVDFTGTTILDSDPDRILDAAKTELDTVIIIGEAKDGSLWVSSSTSDKTLTIYLIETAKFELLSIDMKDRNSEGPSAT